MTRMTTGAALALLLTVCSGWPLTARCAETDGDSPYYDYQPQGWGVALSLGDFGTLLEPGDPAWSRDDLDFLWTSDIEDQALWPLYQIDGITVGRDAEHPDGVVFTDANFDEFYTRMLDDLAQDANLTVLESEANHTATDGRRWQMFHVAEDQGGATEDPNDDATLTYYSLFTLDDGTLRLVNFYYTPLNEADDRLTAEDVLLAIDPGFGAPGEAPVGE